MNRHTAHLSKWFRIASQLAPLPLQHRLQVLIETSLATKSINFQAVGFLASHCITFVWLSTRGSDHIVTVSAVDLCIAESSAQNAFKVASNSISSSFLKLAELVLDHKDNLVKTSTKLGY